jgi:tight adherence protein C
MDATILAPLGSFIAATLLVFGVLAPKRRAKDQLQPYVGPTVASGRVRQTIWGRSVTPVLRFVEASTPAGLQEGIRARLDMAGNPMTSESFLTWQLTGMLLLPLAYILLVVRSGTVFEGRELLLAALLGCVGGYFPKYWLAKRIERRQRSIQRALPDALDLITVSMEAGLALDGALAKVVEKSHGPLSEEFQKTLHEIVLGAPRRQAIRRLGTRTGVRDLGTLVNAIVQADEMGVSMADIMRTQAEDARIRRRQRAEEEARKAPVKMLFPLIAFILPSAMFVTAGPAALVVYHTFHNGFLR